MFSQGLLNFHYDVGRQGIDIHVSSFVFHSVFLSQLHPHIYAIMNVLAEIVFVVFQEIQCLRNNHDDVRHVTELYLYQVSCLSVLRLVRYMT